MAKKKQSRQKKMNTRVDFTPMVDMMMLLITFFMLCTSLAKPQTMNLTNYDDPTCLKETTWGKKGIRDVLISHKTEDGSVPVAEIMAAKIKLDQKKLAHPEQYPDSIYDKMLGEIKKGNLETGKVPTLTCIIKCTDEASYKNMVDALDEMTICSIGTYVIDKINEDDEKLLGKLNIK